MNIDKKTVKDLWGKNMVLYGILKESISPAEARNHIHNYLSELWKTHYHNEEIQLSLEWDIQMAALSTFRRIISVRSARVTDYSILVTLLNLAKEEYNKLPDTLSQGFIDEIGHMLMAMSGQSGIYDMLDPPVYLTYSGRKAAKMRSRRLNEIARTANRFTGRYPHGLMEKVKNRRIRNRKR